MRVYYFTEQPYPDAWNPGRDSLRINLPNRLCEPEVASSLFTRYHDEWQLADELGFDIMVNEHHSTATCLSASVNLTLGILARITKKARLLALGVPLSNRPDPLRVAEEMSMIDVISRGRLDLGFVKGVPYEVAAATSNPVRMMDRLWEAHDFILKAMATHDGPFNWEGEYFQYRNVNIWPRPFQQPHPPVWVTAISPGSAPAVARRGHVIATFVTGLNAKTLFDRYRAEYLATHKRPAALDRFAYLAVCGVGSSRAEGLRRANEVARYLRTSGTVAREFQNPPGYMSPADNLRIFRNPGGAQFRVPKMSGGVVDALQGPLDDLIDAGVVFAGTPDDVHDQIVRFNAAAGGFENLLLMMHGGALSHADTVSSATLFAQHVLPRLKHAAPSELSKSA